jgi:hypothetical protein
MRPENRGAMSQQVWFDKDPSLLKGPEPLALVKIQQPFTSNGDVSIEVNNS